MLDTAKSFASAGRVCSNGVAQAVPAVSFLPTVSRSRRGPCCSNVCRSPPPRSRLPVWVTDKRPRRVKAAQELEGAAAGALVLALTGVVNLHHHTEGSFTHAHLFSSFPAIDS